ncbi:pantoate--beta-alanine ligase [Dyadobacter sp. LHD-138]|uniref:pantoate--beta-alanine ligase n=1 Tax=Dyadobacter sp. LHD-138 TaxID=3071413 RepID=UPI0027DEC099|nr:pantoate--beta-alanine ligase [Dyadobacter sp. LHD-138]MDQ6478892.1 pantoate--beta-alanine ligase [Dyadobacter sp. LHD-138]
MEVFTSIHSLKKFLFHQRLDNKTVGLIPTMGALHEGHISLVETAKQQNDISVASIFVNPTQFNNPEDLAKYPRTLENDCVMLEKAGASVVFAPSVTEMYPEPTTLTMNFGLIETVMEGASRPGHFNGVGVVVSKLFNIVQPNKAYFGQKDLQQVTVVKRLVADLSFNLELVICPTVREDDGLAMSSRNRRLSQEERAHGPIIYKILMDAREKLISGDDTEEVKESVRIEFNAMAGFELDYFEIVNIESLQPIHILGGAGTTALCIAAFLGPVRLIDNIIF